MKVLITGGAGFIGSNLVARCIDMGWTVDVVDDLSSGHVDFLPAWDAGSPRCRTFYQLDFASRIVLDSIKYAYFDAVIHLAAIPRVSYSVEHPLETHDTNVSKTLKLIDACRDNVTRFVFASSSSVYGGAPTLPTPETCAKDPKSPYALQKSVIEDYLKLYSTFYGLDSVSLRFFNVFGPNGLGDGPYATAISAWLTAIKQGRPMRSDGDGEQSRDMCYVDNVTDAIVKAASRVVPLVANRYNIACGDSVTNNQLLAHMAQRYPGATRTDAPTRAGDVKHTLADISRARRDLGYEPTVRVWEGVQRTCDWYDQHWEAIKNMGRAK